jgi:predicted amidophosphoribosyltransferase
MPLAKCVRCKKLFNKEVSPVCGECQEAETADHEKIRALIDRHPNLSAEQVASKAGVDIECVLRMVDQGRLTNTASLHGVKCGGCGAPAISFAKKLCQQCLDKLNSEVAKAQSNIRLPEKRQAQVGEFLPNTRKSFEQKRR